MASTDGARLLSRNTPILSVSPRFCGRLPRFLFPSAAMGPAALSGSGASRHAREMPLFILDTGARARVRGDVSSAAAMVSQEQENRPWRERMTHSIKETIGQLHSALREYIEATYHISAPALIDQRKELLDR